ncbi:MAG TPA: hypothetical protein VGN01_01080 [Acidobacteriaceae bacterium]|jgi:hypothetical protein
MVVKFIDVVLRLPKLTATQLLATCALAFMTQSGICQDSVAALLKTQQLSTIPGVYQSSVEPGGLLILRDKGHTAAYEDASDAAEDYKKRAASFTLGQAQMALVSKVTLSAKLFGYEPSASFASGTALSYDAATFTGTRLTGYQMTTLITADKETMSNIHSWLYSGYHVYLIEAVLATPKLYVTATKATGVSLALNKTATTCATTAPSLPTVVVAPAEGQGGGKGDSAAPAKGDAAAPGGTSTSSNGTSSTTQPEGTKPGGDTNDGTKLSVAAEPPRVEADICKGTAGHYGLNSTAPVNLAVKLQEIVWRDDPSDKTKVIYDYVPVEVVF